MAEVDLDELLSECIARGDTALYVNPDRQPLVRVDGRNEPARPDALTAQQVRDVLLGFLSEAQREALQLRRYVALDYSVVMLDAEVAQFRCVIGLTNTGVVGAFAMQGTPRRMPAMPDPAREALRAEYYRLLHRYINGDWMHRPPDEDVPDDWQGSGGGGAPVPAPLGPRRPLRSGHDAKAIPQDDRGDDNPAAQ